MDKGYSNPESSNPECPYSSNDYNHSQAHKANCIASEAIKILENAFQHFWTRGIMPHVMYSLQFENPVFKNENKPSIEM